MQIDSEVQKYLIVIAGPTAVGKTDLAIHLAKHFNTSIISADARQCFREMSIGTAKPTLEERSNVIHYFIDSHSIQDEMSAGIFETYAIDTLNTIFSKCNVAIVCGGTGLYISALLRGMDSLPPINKDIDKEVTLDYETKGFEWLYNTIKETDIVYFEKGNMNNPARMLRALVFYKSHHQSIIDFRKGNQTKRNFSTIGIGLEVPREVLYDRINLRVDKMIENGLLQEVEALAPFKKNRNLLTVGYQEFYDVGEFPLNSHQISFCIDKIKQHSRNYAKRQLTWFKNKENLTWFSPNQTTDIINHIESIIKN